MSKFKICSANFFKNTVTKNLIFSVQPVWGCPLDLYPADTVWPPGVPDVDLAVPAPRDELLRVLGMVHYAEHCTTGRRYLARERYTRTIIWLNCFCFPHINLAQFLKLCQWSIIYLQNSWLIEFQVFVWTECVILIFK